MNCQQVQDLLPLYVGSELEESRARLVAAHVQNCEMCSEMASGYRETRQLLQTFVPPAFTEDFYEEVRQSVWQNIEKKSTGFTNVIDLFRPRLAWTLATAVLLIAVSAIGIYMISRRSAPQAVVSHQPSQGQTTQAHQPLTASQDDTSTTRLLTSSGSNSGTASVARRRLQQRKTIQDRVRLAAVSAVAPVSPPPLRPSALSDSRHVIYNGSSDASQAPLRMEIQTRNPNIRIIWLTHRDAKSSSPNSRGS